MYTEERKVSDQKDSIKLHTKFISKVISKENDILQMSGTQVEHFHYVFWINKMVIFLSQELELIIDKLWNGSLQAFITLTFFCDKMNRHAKLSVIFSIAILHTQV